MNTPATSRTVKLRLTTSGALVLAHPYAEVGPESSVYAVQDVPMDVPSSQVVQHVSRLALLHPRADVSAWTYAWPDLAPKPPGAVINRLPAET